MAEDGGVEAGGANGIRHFVFGGNRQQVATPEPGLARIGRVRDVLAARLDELLGEFRLRIGGRGRGHGRFDDAEADVVAAAEPGRHAGAVGGAAIVGQGTVGRLFLPGPMMPPPRTTRARPVRGPTGSTCGSGE